MEKEEKKLLKRLKEGLLYGIVGDGLETSGGSMIWTTIEDGNPVRYKKGPTTKFFNGKENEKIPGKLHVLEKWETDEEKIGFLQKFGWLINDEDAKAYSAKYKPKK